MTEIPTRYNPHETEDKWYTYWEEKKYFHAEPDKKKKPYSIVIPPPNVTGILHMGHALNNTIQDILIRYHRMNGFNALWMPGTDHAGIATQNVVEKKLAREGKKRHDLGREKFIEEVREWKQQYGSTIIRQLKKLGCSCDWERERFTMDDAYSKAVREVFVRLYEKGLIYKGNRIINWCPRCQTALSDEEAPHQEMQGSLYYLRYPFKDGGGRTEDGGKRAKSQPIEYLVVATTRPETMLGDTAVAVNPKDKRYKTFIGQKIVLPFVKREIPVIAEETVDMKFGTGAVKITPAHDPNDYLTGRKHGLEFVNVMHPDGRINENGGAYAGMDRFSARQAVVEDLRGQGLLEKIEPHQLAAGHCYRCHTIVEPYLSKQWFVNMKPLAAPAIEAVRTGRITFYPKRWTKVYLNWMEHIQDWCISRQIWWGHRIPVYYCGSCFKAKEEGRGKKEETQHGQQGMMVSRLRPQQCPDCGGTDIRQDDDVLDTWFSSWLWPFATFGWPFGQTEDGGRKTEDGGWKTEEETLNYFYPTSALVTAPEIIFFWVARMIMAGLAFRGEIPFRDVYIHGTVRDIEGKKMSKSLGNVIDPLDIIGEYGADALRFSLISITAQGQDVFLAKERFEQGRNFANKIWNASRLVMMNLEPRLQSAAGDPETPGDVDRWIQSRFHSVLKQLKKDLELYRLNEAANLLYGFFWHEFCDWYLELVKKDIARPRTQQVLRTLLEDFLKALHPFMPFLTEDIWQRLKPEAAAQAASIMSADWPEPDERLIDRRLQRRMESFFDVVTQLRNMRASLELKPDQKIRVSAYPHSSRGRSLIKEYRHLIVELARAESFEVLAQGHRPPAVLSGLSQDVDLYIHLEGIVDIGAEKEKIKGEIRKKTEFRSAKEARLQNEAFLRKAPPQIVAKEQEGVEELGAQIQRLEQMLKELS